MPIDNEDDGLTPEERAALGEDDGAGTNAKTDDAATDTDTNTDEDTKAAEDAAAAAAADADKAKQEADSAAAAKTEETAEAPADTQQTAPILVAQPVADAEARLTELATKKDALLTQFDEGDITAKDYQKQLDDLSKQERKIEFEVHEAQLAAKLEQQRLQNDWNATCNAFIENHAVYKDNPRLYKALDAEVRELAAKPDTANWSGAKFLDEAHKNLKTAFGFNEPDAATTKPADSQRQPRDLPPNLAKVPAANLEDTNGGRFSVLDRLANTDPIAYEEALNKLSATERDAYLAA